MRLFSIRGMEVVAGPVWGDSCCMAKCYVSGAVLMKANFSFGGTETRLEVGCHVGIFYVSGEVAGFSLISAKAVCAWTKRHDKMCSKLP